MKVTELFGIKTQFLPILSLKVKDVRYTEKLNFNFLSRYYIILHSIDTDGNIIICK